MLTPAEVLTAQENAESGRGGSTNTLNTAGGNSGADGTGGYNNGFLPQDAIDLLWALQTLGYHQPTSPIPHSSSGEIEHLSSGGWVVWTRRISRSLVKGDWVMNIDMSLAIRLNM